MNLFSPRLLLPQFDKVSKVNWQPNPTSIYLFADAETRNCIVINGLIPCLAYIIIPNVVMSKRLTRH